MRLANELTTPIIIPASVGEQLIAPKELFLSILNMHYTARGTLRSVKGPTPYVLDSNFAVNTFIFTEANITAPQRFSSLRGLFHGRIGGNQREVMLLHTGSKLWAYNGSTRSWECLIGTGAGGTGLIAAELTNDYMCRLPTQFVQTPNGVVIVCETKRAYFYDGQIIAPLGFDQTPGAPVGLGPSSSGKSVRAGANQSYPGLNDIGYAHDALPGAASGMLRAFGLCRKGTIFHANNADTTFAPAATPDRPSNNSVIAGWLEPGSYRARTAYIDFWGNISPWSQGSNEVRFSRQPSLGSDTTDVKLFASDNVRKQVGWTGISLGPDHCVGRLLATTKDTINSGTGKYFYSTQDSDSNPLAYATIPDNITEFYPDNIPDIWLGIEVKEYIPVPIFSISCLAFSRHWIGDIDGQPSMIYPSEIGLWGTFRADMGIAPDPNGNRITGMIFIPKGLLVFTRNSTFLITQEGKDEFSHTTVSTTIGCLGHDTIRATATDRVFWLGHDGFYTYDGNKIVKYAEDLRLYTDRINYALGRQATAEYNSLTDEYICYCATDGSVENNLGFVFSALGNRLLQDMRPVDLCLVRDSSNVMLGLGAFTNGNGVTIDRTLFALNRSSKNYRPPAVDSRQFKLESGWFSIQAEKQAAAYYKLQLWLVETNDSNITVEVFKNWRGAVELTDTEQFRYSKEDVPLFWDTAVLGTGNWVKTRPFWTVVNFHVPATQGFKFRITGTGDFELIGMRIIGQDLTQNDYQIQPGG